MMKAIGLAIALSTATSAMACEPGIYKAGPTDMLALTARTGDDGKLQYRYTFLDGRRGAIDAPESPVSCADNAVRVKDENGRSADWPMLKLRATPTRFDSHGEKLNGVLIEPEDGQARHPLAIFVHGSERTSPIGGAYPYLLAGQGIAVFAYDKRGTGASEGVYTQNFELLADDAAMAFREAQRLAEGRHARAGFFGGSQGGWVAPLAATKVKADFVAIGFGLVMSPLDEDRDQVASELRAKGYDAAVLSKARAVTDATGNVIASHFTRGFGELAAIRHRFGKERWFGEIQGEFTGEILQNSEAELRRIGPARLDNLGIIWRYDSTPVITGLAIPQLWILAGSDREAPLDVTRDRLLAAKQAGKPIDIRVFPDTDHGMVEFTETSDGTRRYGRITEGYFRLLGDWIRQAPAAASYGRSEIAR